MLLMQYAIFDYTGKKQASTWVASQEAPTPSPVAQAIAPTGVSAADAGPLGGLAGVPLGSRVILHLPPQQNQARLRRDRPDRQPADRGRLISRS